MKPYRILIIAHRHIDGTMNVVGRRGWNTAIVDVGYRDLDYDTRIRLAMLQHEGAPRFLAYQTDEISAWMASQEAGHGAR